MEKYIFALVRYGLDRGLIEKADEIYTVNQLLMLLELDGIGFEPMADDRFSLEEILQALTENAVGRGLCADDISSRDLFDTRLMGVLTPRPSAVRARFVSLYQVSPQAACDWFYRFSQDTDYIRRYRIQKDMRWKTPAPYGELDITINLSKPEKDPKTIAAERAAPALNYPLCPLCLENEGYAGRLGHPARENHRVIPVTLAGEDWFLQYSPYVYYNEHCIVINSRHLPMKIDRSTFNKLFDFVTLFPHYFVGSNADLPIVGGSILSHEHFQGGRCTLPMERARAELLLSFADYPDVEACILNWPVSVIRLKADEPGKLAQLAQRILEGWRGYTDREAFIFAEQGGEPHNTITPVARRNGRAYELDLALRNNLTTEKHPLGVYHPHRELHHIKKENIGLIEVMGLAVLPSRLKAELARLKTALITGEDIKKTDELLKHADWADKLKKQYAFTECNAEEILQKEVGRVFAKVLEQTGVYKQTPLGRQAFLRFIRSVGGEEKR